MEPYLTVQKYTINIWIDTYYYTLTTIEYIFVKVFILKDLINIYIVYVGFWWGNLTEKRPLGRPSRRWEDNTSIDLQEVGCVVMDWIQLAQDRDRWRALVYAVMNLRVS